MPLTIAVIIWGVGGTAALFASANWLIEQFSVDWQRRIQPFIFVGPAMLLLGWFLFLPTIRTLYLDGQAGDEATPRSVDLQRATPGYFAAMGIPLERGRFISDSDKRGGQRVAVIVPARTFWLALTLSQSYL